MGRYYADRGADIAYLSPYTGYDPSARYYSSRLYLVTQELADVHGDLLDVGCGSGIAVRELLDSRPGEFRITALDSSPSKVEACVRTIDGADNAEAMVARAEAMPFAEASFDVVLALGVLEYTDTTAALAEISRATRPDGLALITMLNPTSPYRLVEWYCYWPMRNAARMIKHLPSRRRVSRAPGRHGIRAYPERSLRTMLEATGLHPINVMYYDVNFLVPPFDRYLRRWLRGWQQRPERTIGQGWRKWFGTAYMVVARRK